MHFHQQLSEMCKKRWERKEKETERVGSDCRIKSWQCNLLERETRERERVWEREEKQEDRSNQEEYLHLFFCFFLSLTYVLNPLTISHSLLSLSRIPLSLPWFGHFFNFINPITFLILSNLVLNISSSHFSFHFQLYTSKIVYSRKKWLFNLTSRDDRVVFLSLVCLMSDFGYEQSQFFHAIKPNFSLKKSIN